QPNRRTQSHRPPHLPPVCFEIFNAHRLVRLLERTKNPGRSSPPGRRAPRSNPTLRPRRIDPPSRPTGAIRRRKTKRPHRTPHLPRRQRQLHALSGRRRQLQLRDRPPRHHPHHLVAIRQHPYHRITHRHLHRHARRNHLQHRMGQTQPRHRRRSRTATRQNHHLSWLPTH